MFILVLAIITLLIAIITQDITIRFTVIMIPSILLFMIRFTHFERLTTTGLVILPTTIIIAQGISIMPQLIFTQIITETMLTG